MVCDVLDVRCIVVNELIGDPILTMLIATVVYFIIASKMKLGFETTLTFLIPVALVIGSVVAGFGVIYAFTALVVGIMLSLVVLRLIGNK